MKRHKSLIFISHDHYHGLQLAQLIKKNSPKFKNLPNDLEGKKSYTINFYENDLLHHFYLEENIIQPAVKGKTKEIDKLFEEIIVEHKNIERAVESLKENSNTENKLDEIGIMLQEHIRKEEQILFEKIQKALSENELQKLEEELHSYEDLNS
ncbi:MAG: hemerythrin domain-containing protein [Ignavibacteriaceae bacterium]